MRVFVYEYVCAGGGGPLVEPLRAEGAAMLAAVLEDWDRVPGGETLTLWDAGRPVGITAGQVRQVRPGEDEADFRQLARAADATFVIAPESADVLATRCRWVEEAGGRWLGSSWGAIRLTGDKLALGRHLQGCDVPTPACAEFDGTSIQKGEASAVGHAASVPDQNGTLAACPTTPARREPRPPESGRDLTKGIGRDFPFPAVWKPRDGVGSTATFLVRDAAECRRAAELARGEGWNGQAILQAFAPGQPASVAVLVGPRQRIALLPAEQRLSTDGRFHYLGGKIPLARELAERAQALALRAVEAVPGLAGYVGVDLVLGADERGDCVIEVNPRLTTSYVGLRALAETNLMSVLLELSAGRPVPPLAWRSGEVTFEASGKMS